jgi:fumarate hydratase, class II
VPVNKLWDAQTQRSLENFNIARDTDRMPSAIVKAFGILKKCSAKVNVHFGLDPIIAEAIISAS